MAFDAFLKIEDSSGNNFVIQGESTDKTHPGEIEVDSFSWGVSNPATIGSGSGGGVSAGKASASSLEILAPLSKASPNLMLACATGKHLPAALLTCRKTGANPVEFLKIKLTDCLIESYQVNGRASDGSPEDAFSIAFAKIDMTYTVARTGETVEAFMDFSSTAG